MSLRQRSQSRRGDDRASYEDAFKALSRKTPTRMRARSISPIPDSPPSSQDGWTDEEEDQEEESSQ